MENDDRGVYVTPYIVVDYEEIVPAGEPKRSKIQKLTLHSRLH